MRSDILEEMTKEEIIAWARRQWLRLPTRSEMLFGRWEIQSQKVLDEDAAESARFAALNLDFAKRDEYARQFNASKDPDEKLRLLRKMKPYDDALSDHIKRSQAIAKKQKAVDALYESIEAAREQEQVPRPHPQTQVSL